MHRRIGAHIVVALLLLVTAGASVPACSSSTPSGPAADASGVPSEVSVRARREVKYTPLPCSRLSPGISSTGSSTGIPAHSRIKPARSQEATPAGMRLSLGEATRRSPVAAALRSKYIPRIDVRTEPCDTAGPLLSNRAITSLRIRTATSYSALPTSLSAVLRNLSRRLNSVTANTTTAELSSSK